MVNEHERTMDTKYLLSRFLPYFSNYKLILFFDLLCASLTTISELFLPMMVRHITGLATNAPEDLTLKVIFTIGGGYILLKIVEIVANYFMQSVGHIMGANIETDMRRDMFNHIQKMSMEFFSNTKVAHLMSRITSDLSDVTEFAHHFPEEVLIALVTISVSFVILMGINVPLTLIIFAFIPLMALTTRSLHRQMRRDFKRSRKQIARVNADVEDSLLGIRVVKSFANEDIEEEKFKEGNHGFLDVKKDMYYTMAKFHSVVRFFDGLMYIVVVVVGAIFLINNQITVPDYIAYLMYVTTLLASVRRIVQFLEQFQNGMTGIERFLEIMDTPVDIMDKENAYELENVKGEIIFDHVSFSYDDTKQVLDDFNLAIKPGQNIALVGPSGGGKTTISNLIQRFYELDSGAIIIDGHDISDVTLSSLRNNIGVVQQDVYLFSGNVYDNIEYGMPGATREEIIQAAKLAGAHEFISELSDGYETYVGERGVKLSGGQQQRISIARVFLKNPPILVLDEATSALDNENERLVQQSLEALAKNRTTITIAHRLTTIINADQIVVLTDEGIEEIGTHQQLIDSKGAYYDLYQMYVKSN